MRIVKIWLVVFVFCSVEVFATEYNNGINESSWLASSSLQSCELTHAIPSYGNAVFQTRAGEEASFTLKGFKTTFTGGEANVFAVSPPWQLDQMQLKIGQAKTYQTSQPLRLQAQITERLLDALLNGRYVQFEQRAWFATDEQLQDSVIVNNIGFRSAYQSYLGCLSELLPANYDQLRRSSIFFNVPGSADVAYNSMMTLENIAILIKHDDAINKIFIDGHSSSFGSSEDNLNLSQARAEIVAELLKGLGVDESMMVVRWHGERYPIASNQTQTGRAKNRRVTIRLDKEVLPSSDSETLARR